VLKYCPVEDCPSHFPYLVRGELCYRPRMVAATAADRTRCGSCGEYLEHTCPDEECAAPVNDASFCTRCGNPYVTSTRRERGPALAAWVEHRRQDIRELRMAGGAEGAAPALPSEEAERPPPRRGRSEGS
jgi:hypothetical protein